MTTRAEAWCVIPSLPPLAASAIQTGRTIISGSLPLSVLPSGSHTTVRRVKCLIELKCDYDECGEGVGISFFCVEYY